MSPADLADLAEDIEIAEHNIRSAECDLAREHEKAVRARLDAEREVRAAEREVERYRARLAELQAELRAAVAEVAA